MTFKILFTNQDEYSIFNTTTFEPVVLNGFVPQHLFTNDVFSIDESGQINIISSTVRQESMSGVLCLQNNKTYGRTKGGGAGRLLYKCIPDDKRIPPFLVPYDIKSVGFSKVLVNHYVTFKFKEWYEKHPHGIIMQNIGPVNILDNFYEYQLYCKSLNASIQKFTKDTTLSLQNTTHDEFIENMSKQYPNIENRINSGWNIFTIDPQNTCDFDDAFSIRIMDGGKYLLSIYISNVTICMDSLNLWESFSKRISTIYLPNKKRPMLPTVLSECICSLVEDHKRIAFVMDIYVDDKHEIEDIRFSNCLIKVNKNYVYEEHALLTNKDYCRVFDLTQNLAIKYKYIANVRNSREMVCYLMIFMNYHSAKRMMIHKNGIFRTSNLVSRRDLDASNNQMPDDVRKFIKMWTSSSCQYVDFSKNEYDINHELLEIEAYIHITSPIRRLVDLLNMIQFQINNQMISFKENAVQFYNKWIGEIEYINITMKAIRKVQNHCSLLDLCVNVPETVEKEYDGYLFDKIVKNEDNIMYIVYLPELKLTYKICLQEDVDYGEKRRFTIFMFSDEDSLKRKIRLQIVGK
jgi:exoribonuclease R